MYTELTKSISAISPPAKPKLPQLHKQLPCVVIGPTHKPATMHRDELPILSGWRPTSSTSHIYPDPLSMSLERQAYEEYCSNIRARPIGWDGYHRAHIITTEEVGRIKAIDKVPLERRIEIVKKDPEAYAKLFLGDGTEGSGILGRTAGSKGGTDTSIIQYILVLMGDLLESTLELYTNVQWGEEICH